MIRRLVLRRFKRFEEEIFTMDGHVVLAGPNNSGKTTVLQAIAAFSLALYRWKMLNNFHRRQHPGVGHSLGGKSAHHVSAHGGRVLRRH